MDIDCATLCAGAVFGPSNNLADLVIVHTVCQSIILDIAIRQAITNYSHGSQSCVTHF
jgi:hypothetical protein